MVELQYPGYDNTTRRLLKEDGLAKDLQNFTQMQVRLGGVVVDSANGENDPIRWNQAGQATGELEIFWSRAADFNPTPGRYTAYLVVFDAGSPHGLIWDSFAVRVVAVN